jgi:hypothetical protein
MSALICPILRAYQLPGKDQACLEEKCAWWDRGVFDRINPGCGKVSRENRGA